MRPDGRTIEVCPRPPVRSRDASPQRGQRRGPTLLGRRAINLGYVIDVLRGRPTPLVESERRALRIVARHHAVSVGSRLGSHRQAAQVAHARDRRVEVRSGEEEEPLRVDVRPSRDVARAAHLRVRGIPGKRDVASTLAKVLPFERRPSKEVA